jgi:hypothetical protein
MNLATGSDHILFTSGRHLFNVVDGEQKLRTTGITGFATVFAYYKVLRSCDEKLLKKLQHRKRRYFCKCGELVAEGS